MSTENPKAKQLSISLEFSHLRTTIVIEGKEQADEPAKTCFFGLAVVMSYEHTIRWKHVYFHDNV